MSLQLPRVATGYFSTAKLNQALDSIESHINNNVVHRQDGQTSMYQVLDMNGNSLINVETGDTPTSLVNRDYVDRVLPAMEASASSSASAARTSELNASGSENKALEYEQSALQHEQDALQHLKDFKGVYIGTFSEAPTADAYGNAVEVGDLYFDTTLNEVRVREVNGLWKSAGSTVNGTSNRHSFVGDGTTTTFEIIDGYDPTFADIYLNGVKLQNNVDVDVTSGTDIVFSIAPEDGDIVDFVGYGAFEVADTYSRVFLDEFMNNTLKAVTDNANNHLKLKLELMQKGVI